MKRILPVVICMLLLSLMRYATGCQKELMNDLSNGEATDSTTNPVPGNAVFSLSGAPGNCTNSIITGTFVAGIEPAVSNNIKLDVMVSTAGNYRINTDTVNGIYFSTAGKFISTGLQQVTLYSNGKPITAGSFDFMPETFTGACSFNIIVDDSASLADYNIIAGPGDPGGCAYTVTGTYITGLELNSSNNATIAINVSRKGNFNITTNSVNGFSFSASGVFITLGRQVINLYGTGAPVSKGIYGFIPRIVGPYTTGPDACSFDVTVQ